MMRWFRRLRGEIRGLYAGGDPAEIAEALSVAGVHLDTPPVLLDEAPTIVVPIAQPADCDCDGTTSNTAERPYVARNRGDHS